MIDGRIKLRHLQCFLSIARHGSLQAAAAALSITQPAVSKTVKELEEILQARLFDRGRKGAALTREAEVFFEYAEASVNALQQATSAMAQLQTQNPVVKFGASPTLTASFVPQVLAALHRKLEHIQVTLLSGTTQQLILQLRESEFDLVLCRHFDPEQMMGLSFEYLFVDPMVAVVHPRHPLLDLRMVRVPDLRRFTAVLPIKGSINRHIFDKFARDRSISVASNFIETLSVTLGRIYTLSNDAIWFAPWSAVKYDVEHGSLTKLQLPVRDDEGSSEVMARTIGVMTRTNSVLSPEARLLIRTIREIAAERRNEGA